MGDEHKGDLSRILNLPEQLQGIDYEYFIKGFDMNDSFCTEEIFRGMWSYHATDADPRTIYVIRDSFSSNMADYIGSQFTDSFLMYRDAYTYDDLVARNPDIVVYEIVERHVETLESFSIR